MNGFDPRNYGRDDRAGDFVDDFTKGSVFLRWAANDRERPDCISTMVDSFDVKDGKVVGQAVVSEMVAEWAFWQQLIGVDSSRDTEIGFRRHRQSVLSSYHANGPTAQCSCE